MQTLVPGQMTYFGEIRTYWRFLAAAAIGQAAGYSLVNYISNIFTPHLMKEFGWARSDFALVGTMSLLGILAQPIAGRLADAYGVKRMAMVGVACAPLVFLALSAMTGELYQFFLLTLVQMVIVGGTTTAVIYSRLVAQRFDKARGVALAVAACAAPGAAAALVPFLSVFIDANGWRAGYIAVAVLVAIGGFVALWLLPPGADAHRGAGVLSHNPARDYGVIARDPAFRLLILAMLLCNLSFSMQTSQLKVILLDRGVDTATGSLAISLFAVSVIVGRLLCGVALDRFPAYAVSAISLGLPGLGLGLLATGLATPTLIALAVLLLGLSLGAEGDVIAYLVARYFKPEIYSTVLGLVLGALAFAIAVGALLLSIMLKLTGSYTPYLVVVAVAALVGAGMLALLGRLPTNR